MPRAVEIVCFRDMGLEDAATSVGKYLLVESDEEFPPSNSETGGGWLVCICLRGPARLLPEFFGMTPTAAGNILTQSKPFRILRMESLPEPFPLSSPLPHTTSSMS
jgi:hypothetical protein